MNLFYNGQLFNEEELKISSDNRGLNYGDGIFETMKFINGKISFLNDHYERILSATCACHLKLPENFNPEYIENSVKTLCEVNQLKDARIKILMWRKQGGLFSPESEDLDYLITTRQWQDGPEIKPLVIFSQETKNYSTLSAYKTLSSSLYIMAGIEKRKKNVDDIILLNHNQEIVECLNSNIFWEKDLRIYTPAIKTGCIGGVMRKQILANLKSMGTIYEEGHYFKEQLLNADLVFTSNIAGISRIDSIEGTLFRKDSDVFRKLCLL